ANTGASGSNTVTLTTNNTTLATLNLQSGLFAAGTGQNINLSNGGVINDTGGDFATGATAGRVTIPTSVSASFNGTSNPYEVYTSGGINFGAQTVTIQNGGTFRINNGGFVNTNAPFYGTGSTLQYWINGPAYGRSLEWSASSGRGYPHHVQISNNTTVDPASSGAAQANTPLRTAGNLTIDANSAMYMDNSGNNMNEDLVVSGNLVLSGSLSGSQASGSDIFIGGNWQNDGTSANFFPNNRAVFLNGTGTQTISGTNVSFPAFPLLFIDKTAGSVILLRDVEVSELLTFSTSNVSTISTGAKTLYVSKNLTTAINRQGSGHVVGNLQRAVATGSNTYNYPIGDATAYAPASLALNNVTGAGSITASTTGSDHPQLASSGLNASMSVNRYYTLSNTGVTLANYSPTFTFVAGDVDAGASTSSFLVGLYNAGWSYPTTGTLTSTTTQATGVSTFGEFAIGECKTPTAFNVTGGGSYCAGGSGVAVGTDGSETGVSYQLRRNGTDTGSPVAGTGSALSFGNQTAAGSYIVVANSLASGNCSNNMTGSVAVNINPSVNTAVTISTTATSICTGTSVTFTATPQFGGSAPTYQWRVNGTNVGTNSTTYTSSSLVNGDLVTCLMTSNEACPSPATAASNSITMSVLPFGTPTLSISASSSTTICAGDVLNFTSSATFEGSLPTYDWKINGTSAGTGPTFSSFALANGDQVSCVLTSNYQCANAPTAASNTLTITVVAAPQVEAGSNMTTCGTAPYPFANGASRSNTAASLWTHNGLGTITNASTLTPTYTPASGDVGTTVTFTLTGNGNGPCAAVADNVTLQITPLTLYYIDSDSDGFGNPLSSPVASCTPVAGRVADNTDCCDSNADINPMAEWWADVDGDGVGGFIFQMGCISGCSGFAQTIPYYPGAHGGAPYSIDCDDTQATSYPGASEICGDLVDNNCNITIDEGCSGIINDGFAFATLLNVNNTNAYYPNCQTTNGSVINADISAEGNPANVSATVGSGRDSWFRFVAPSTAAQIKVVPSGFDAVIELRTAAHPSGQIDVENVNNTIGGTEIMNVSNLTVGQTYYVAVRNYNATSVGTFTLCVAPIRASGCATTQPLAGLSLCSTFKAVYRGATSYTFNFTGTGGTAPTPYATTSATVNNTTIISLNTPSLALRNGGVYNVRVDANFTLLNGAGVADPMITLQGVACSRTIAAAPPME
ncbi:MAG: MopE-related protein, partial [Flavobacteriales bacterium]